jgi:hypothetical protein
MEEYGGVTTHEKGAHREWGADRDPDGRVGKAGDVETRRPGSGFAAVKTVSVR